MHSVIGEMFLMYDSNGQERDLRWTKQIYRELKHEFCRLLHIAQKDL